MATSLSTYDGLNYFRMRQSDGQMTPGERDYDLFSPAFKRDPFSTWARMRGHDPIYPHRAPDGSTIWYVTRYADAIAVLRDDVNYCKDPCNAFNAEALPRRKSAVHQLINENMLFADPPEHTRLRALVNQAFTPRRIEQLRPRVLAIADRLLDGIAGEGAADLIVNYALPLPVAIISELLGIPEADRVEVASWSQAIVSPGSRNLNYSTRKQRVRAFIDYLQGLFADRQTNPQDDLVTALVQAEEAGQRLNEAELSSMVALLLVTGHETTVNLIGNGVLALLLHPEQRWRLEAQPDLWPAAVEELLRYDGPVETSTTRWARRDHELQGHQIRRGDVVRMVLSSTNRDADRFTAPDELRVDREENRHLAFGLGIHYCLGAPLARLEGHVALQRLFERLPELELGVPPAQLRWRSGVLFRGLVGLPVRWIV